MKKKSNDGSFHNGKKPKINWLAMKLMTFLLFAGSMTLSASTYSQKTKIDLHLQNSSLSEIFSSIEKSSEFIFFYDDEVVNDKMTKSVSADGEIVEKILEQLFKGTDIAYKIDDRQVFLYKKGDLLAPESLSTSVIQQPQKIELSGTVADTKGLPLPGVSIVVKGTTVGITSDNSGKFSLKVPSDSKVLVFSFVGMITQEIVIGNKRTFTITLNENKLALDEVVVTALGIVKSKKSLTYSTQEVNLDELTTNKDINLGNALSSKVAGVTVTTSSGASGVSGDALVIIRGNRSISNGNQPLIVMDGIPYSTGGGGLSGINPDDVQSINVLKGPSASALYGSAANNGVIVVTTKKAGNGVPKIEFNSTTNFDVPYLYPEFQNEYSQGASGIYNSATEYSSWGPKMQGQNVTNWTGEQIALNAQPNNVKDFFRTGYNLVNNFSYSGGNEKLNVYFSYSNTTAQGVLDDNKLSRNNLNLRLGAELIKNLKMDFRITYYRDDLKDKPVVGDDLFSPMFNLIKMPRSIRTQDIRKSSYFDEKGSRQQNSWFPASTNNLNPYWSMDGYEAPSSSSSVNSLLNLRYDFADWLYLQVRGGVSSGASVSEEKIYWNTPYFFAGHGNYKKSLSKGQSYNGDVLLSFTKKFAKDFNLGLSFGAEINDSKGTSIASEAGGLNTENKFALAFAQALRSSDGDSRSQKQSVYGMGQLDFRNYLFLNATARNDWSSTLPSPHDYFYPSVGLTGIVSDMVKLPDFVSFAKIRGSYAEVGNDARWASIMQTYQADNVGPIGIVHPDPTRVAVNLIPEKSKSWELGAELKLFENRLSFDFTWYKSNTYNQLVEIASVPSSGYDHAWMNCGNILNKGVELMISATPVKLTDFSWNVNLNFAKNKNKVIELSDKLERYQIRSPNLSIGETWIIKGKPYGEMYTKGFQRNNQGQIIVDALGQPKVLSTADLYLGNFNYDWTSGITNSFKYKNWNMSFLVDLNYGGVRGSSTEAMMLSCGTSKASLVGRENGILIDGVFENGTKNNITINAEDYYRSVGGRISNGCGELFSHEATNSRLREFAIGYSFPLKSNVIKSLRLSATGRNLFFIYNGCKWFDPDVSYDISTNGQGAESAFLPGTRTLGFNIKLTL